MTVFGNLLSLYRKNGASAIPVEDFCTECLAGILLSDSELLSAFVDDILKIESDLRFKVTTQRSYYSKDSGELGRIDMVLESESELCFVEIKVGSGEGEGQLDKYARILSEQPKTIVTYLRYCTLYIEDKEPRYIEDKETLFDFDQFRWADIAKFLAKKTKNNELVREYYNFLKEMNMAGNERFNHEDLVGLKTVGEITRKVNEIFILIEEKLRLFGTVIGGVKNTSQIIDHNRLAKYCPDVIGGSSSEVLVSFDFKGIVYEDEPVVAVQLFVNKKNSSYKNFYEIAGSFYQEKEYEGKKIFL